MSIKEIVLAIPEGDIQELLHIRLLKHDYDIRCASDGKEAIKMIQSKAPDLVIIDIDLPNLDGLEVCKWLRHINETKNIPVMMFAGQSNEAKIINALEFGADDYFNWPINIDLLVAKIGALSRRLGFSAGSDNDYLEAFDIRVFPRKRLLTIKGKKIETTYSEFQILYILMKKPGWVFTREQIVEAIRGKNYSITDRSVDVQIVGLRKKMGAMGHVVETVRGVGYRFKEA